MESTILNSRNDATVKEENCMISVGDAKQLILKTCSQLERFSLELSSAHSYILSKDIFSQYTIPPFRQSAMDGYALCFSDLHKCESLLVVGEIPAGEIWTPPLQDQQALRIFTGACVPDTADTVVEQERVSVQGNNILIRKEGLVAGANIRPVGSQILSGELALPKGSKISPASIGFLASIGIGEVEVFRKPKIAIIITGNELQAAGTTLQSGNIFESNSSMLIAALKESEFYVECCLIVGDNESELEEATGNLLGTVDLIIFTGGISVGDYDLVRKKLNSAEFQNVFYKVKQKPGKPIWYGMQGRTKIFALPGNPAAVLTCYYEYVLPALRIMCGHSQPFLPQKQLNLKSAYHKKSGLAHFLKGRTEEGFVTILDAQESYKLNTFAKADCLIYVPEDKTSLAEGEIVEVHLLPE
ncbi:MAG: molybdopterin molybdotransferase MoeA [Bacteroidia bacterium]|nr:molybdopterin molybdotransferase MoeA [Bacteroidia bacterium]